MAPKRASTPAKSKSTKESKAASPKDETSVAPTPTKASLAKRQKDCVRKTKALLHLDGPVNLTIFFPFFMIGETLWKEGLETWRPCFALPLFPMQEVPSAIDEFIASSPPRLVAGVAALLALAFACLFGGILLLRTSIGTSLPPSYYSPLRTHVLCRTYLSRPPSCFAPFIRLLFVCAGRDRVRTDFGLSACPNAFSHCTVYVDVVLINSRPTGDMGIFGHMLLLVCSVTVSSGYYVPISPSAEHRLHALGKQTVQKRQLDMALTYYRTAAEHGQSSTSHLLLVLHLQAGGAPRDRQAFRRELVDRSSLLAAGMGYQVKHMANAQGSHHGERRNRSFARVRWSRFRDYVRANNPLASPSKRGVPLPGYEIYDI